MPSRSQNGREMKDNFDQHAGQSPRPPTGSRQAGHNVGKARSSAARKATPAAVAARWSGVGSARLGERGMGPTLPPGEENVMSLKRVLLPMRCQPARSGSGEGDG
jgi:hypothetical protein